MKFQYDESTASLKPVLEPAPQLPLLDCLEWVAMADWGAVGNALSENLPLVGDIERSISAEGRIDPELDLRAASAFGMHRADYVPGMPSILSALAAEDALYRSDEERGAAIRNACNDARILLETIARNPRFFEDDDEALARLPRILRTGDFRDATDDPCPNASWTPSEKPPYGPCGTPPRSEEDDFAEQEEDFLERALGCDPVFEVEGVAGFAALTLHLLARRQGFFVGVCGVCGKLFAKKRKRQPTCNRRYRSGRTCSEERRRDFGDRASSFVRIRGTLARALRDKTTKAALLCESDPSVANREYLLWLNALRKYLLLSITEYVDVPPEVIREWWQTHTAPRHAGATKMLEEGRERKTGSPLYRIARHYDEDTGRISFRIEEEPFDWERFSKEEFLSPDDLLKCAERWWRDAEGKIGRNNTPV